MTEKLVIATVHTRNFTFTALGRDESEAGLALLDAYAAHAERTGADPDLMRELIDDEEINWERLAPGEASIR